MSRFLTTYAHIATQPLVLVQDEWPERGDSAEPLLARSAIAGASRLEAALGETPGRVGPAAHKHPSVVPLRRRHSLARFLTMIAGG